MPLQVYEHGVPAPPLSPGARTGPSDSLSGSFSRGTPTAAAAAAAAVVAADAAAAAAPGGSSAVSITRASDSTGTNTETPRAGRQVLNPAEAAELKAAAVAATAAAGTNGGSTAAASTAAASTAAAAPAAGDGTTAGGTSSCPTPPPGVGAAAAAAAAAGGLSLPGMASSGLPSIDTPDLVPPAREPTKKGRFKIIEEENPSSRAPSKVSSSADLTAVGRSGSMTAAAAAGAPAGRGMGGSVAAALPELLRLHEQSVSHANALARVIDNIRASCSGTNLAAAAGAGGSSLASVDDASPPSAAAAGGGGAGGIAATAAAAAALPPRKPAAAVGAGGLLSRGNSSSRVLLCGPELKVLTLQQLLQEHNGDALDLAEKLYERVQVRVTCHSTAQHITLWSFVGRTSVQSNKTWCVDKKLLCISAPWYCCVVAYVVTTMAV